MSYYIKINNIDYDKALLDTVNEAVNGQGDGRISVNDINNIMKKILDKSIITLVEHRTIYYIINNYNFTEAALKKFLSLLEKI